MSHPRPAHTLPLRRVVPSLLALGLVGSMLHAAEPIISGPTVGTAATVTFSVEWTDDMNGWNPRDAGVYSAGYTGGGLRVFTVAAAGVLLGTAPNPNIATAANVTLTPITTAEIVSSNAHKTTITVPVGAGEKIYAQIPITSAFKQTGSASPASYPAANYPSLTTAQLVYTRVPAGVDNHNVISFPGANSATTERMPTLAILANIDGDGTGAINPLFSTSDVFSIKISDDISAGVVGTSSLNKNGVTWVDATTGDQTVGVTLSTPLTAGAHTLTSKIYDPLGTLVTGAANPTINLLVWDRPTLAINGVSSSSTFIIDRTNNILFTGTKFSMGAFTSAVTMKVDGTTITPDTVLDPTKFAFTIPTLAASASHTVELTQTYTGTVVTGSPTLVSNFTLDNSTTLDVTPPDAPIVASPAASGTIYTLKPIITGQAEPLATIKMRIDDGTTVTNNSTTVTASATGAFTFAATDWVTGLAGGGLLASKTYTIQTAATDAAGNVSAWSDSGYNLTTPASAAYARFSPSAGITSTGGVNYSKTATAVFDVQIFNLAGTQVTGAALAGQLAADFVVTNGTVALTTSTDSDHFTITVTPTAAGIVTINSPADAFTVGGISTSAATTYTFIKDVAAPVFTGGIVSNGTSITSVGTTFKVALTSNEVMSSTFDTTKITFTYTAGTTPAATPNVAPVGSAHYGLTPTSGSGATAAYLSADGKTWTQYYTVTGAPTALAMTVAAGAGTDLAGNNSGALAVASRTLDTAVPSVAIAGMLASTATAVTKATPIVFTTTFGEAVTGFDVSDFDVTNGVVSLFAATPTVYTLTVIPGEGPTPVKVAIKSGTVVNDLVGNSSTFSGNVSGVNFLTRTYDSTAPRVLSLASSTAAPTSTDDKPTNKTSIPCSLVLSESVTGLTAASFQVENGAISGLTGSGSVYTFNLDVSAPTTVDKKVRAVLMAGKVADSVGNLNSSVAVLLRNYDGTVPTLDFGTPALALSSVNTTSGTATAVSATTATHAAAGWTVDAYIGQTVTMGGSTMLITSNTATVLTGAAWVGGTPAFGAYTIKKNDAKATFTVTVNAGGTTSDVLATKFDPTKLVLIGGTLDSVTPTNTTINGTSRLQTFQVIVTLPRGAGNVVTLQALPGAVTDMAGNKNASVSGVLTVPGNG